MDIKQVARNFDKEYRPFAWYHSIGVNEDTLFVYVNSKYVTQNQDNIPDVFQGYSTRIMEVGEVRALIS